MSLNLLDQKPLVEEFLQRESPRPSAFSFVNIFSWKDFFDFKFHVMDDTLCAFAHYSLGCFQYLPPLGKKVSPETLQRCFEIMETVNKGNGLSRIENVPQEQLSLFNPREYDYFKKGDEYCYYREEIALSKGNRFKAKRASYNHFKKHYRHDFLPFCPQMTHECEGLYERWAANRRKKYSDDVYRQMLEENRTVHALLFKFYKELGLIGRVVTVDGKIEAYTFGFALTRDIFCVLVEIANVDVKGLPVYVFRQFCDDPEMRPFKFVNGMDGFGMHNVEETKLSFRPHILFPAYVVTRK